MDSENLVYVAKIEMTGEKTGVMDCQLTFNRKEAKLLFEIGENGKPLSYGYAEYEGKRINVKDMSH